MTKGEKFRSKASEIIAKFAVENGKSTYHRVTGRAYSTETGTEVDTPVPQQAYMAFDEIAIELSRVGNAVVIDPEYLKDHMLALIAGNDLPVTPKEGDLITPAGGTGKHRVVNVGTDMYEALFTCYITRKPV